MISAQSAENSRFRAGSDSSLSPTLVPLTQDDREQFILDNQWAFKHGALYEFGERDDHLDFDGEIISRKTIEHSIDAPENETYRIVLDGKSVGGVILKIDTKTHCNDLEILFVSPEEHGKGVGYGAWLAVEALHPKQRNGARVLRILINAIYIFTSTNAVFKLTNSGASTSNPTTRCPTMMNAIPTKDLTKCLVSLRL